MSQIISDWFLEHDNEFTFLKWPPQSPDLNPIEHFWDVVEREIHIMDAQLTNLQQLRDAIMSIWPKSLRNVSNTLLNLCHEELRQFWRQNGVQPGTSKVYLIKWLVSVCIYIYTHTNIYIHTQIYIWRCCVFPNVLRGITFPSHVWGIFSLFSVVLLWWLSIYVKGPISTLIATW